MLLLYARKNSFHYLLIISFNFINKFQPPTRLLFSSWLFRNLIPRFRFPFRVYDTLLDISLRFSLHSRSRSNIDRNLFLSYPASYRSYRVKILIRNVIHGARLRMRIRKSVLHLGTVGFLRHGSNRHAMMQAHKAILRVLTRQRAFVLCACLLKLKYLLSN